MASTSSQTQHPTIEATNIYAYYENWHIKLESFHEKLNAISATYDIFVEEKEDDDEKESDSSKLMTQVLCHYREYYQEKFKATNSDVFLLVSPPWYTSLERIFIWVAGFRPSMLFPTINSSIGSGLSLEQGEKLKWLKTEVKMEEKIIEKALAKVQESVAAPPLIEQMRRGVLLVGEASQLESDVDALKQSMMTVIETAEHLRESTVRKVLDILRQNQAVKLMAAVAQFHIQARKCGLQMDNNQSTAETSN